jgi:hypothetical protein
MLRTFAYACCSIYEKGHHNHSIPAKDSDAASLTAYLLCEQREAFLTSFFFRPDTWDVNPCMLQIEESLTVKG